MAHIGVGMANFPSDWGGSWLVFRWWDVQPQFVSVKDGSLWFKTAHPEYSDGYDFNDPNVVPRKTFTICRLMNGDPNLGFEIPLADLYGELSYLPSDDEHHYFYVDGNHIQTQPLMESQENADNYYETALITNGIWYPLGAE